MQRYRLANLSQHPSVVYVGDMTVGEAQREWVQRADMWTIIYYHHHNVVGMDNATFVVRPGSMVFYAPGVRASHARIGEELKYTFVTFDLPGTSDRMAIPIVVEDMASHWPGLVRARSVITVMLAPLWAWIWN